MTAVKYVTRDQMKKQTGMDTLGYAKPKNSLILLRKGMSKKQEMEVREHEFEHIKKGEEGPFWGAVIGAGASLLGAKLGGDATRDASDASAKAADVSSRRTLEAQRRSLEELQRQYELTRLDTTPYRLAGVNALNYLNTLLLPGINRGYVDPSIINTPDYLQPKFYDAEGGVSSTPEYESSRDRWISGGKQALKDAAKGKAVSHLGSFGKGGFKSYGLDFKDQFDPENLFGFGHQPPGYEPTFSAPGYSQPTSTNYFTGSNGRSLRNGGIVGPDHPSQRVVRPQSQAVQANEAAPRTVEGEYIPAGSAPALAPTGFNPGGFEADPGYQFRVQEGTDATQNYLSAKKMRLSGRALKAMERFRQGLASQEYGNFYQRRLAKHQQDQQDTQNYLSRIFQMAGFGPGGVNTAATAGQNLANTSASINTGTASALNAITQGNATNQANLGLARANIYNNAIQSGASNYLAWQRDQELRNQLGNNYGGAALRGARAGGAGSYF